MHDKRDRLPSVIRSAALRDGGRPRQQADALVGSADPPFAGPPRRPEPRHGRAQVPAEPLPAANVAPSIELAPLIEVEVEFVDLYRLPGADDALVSDESLHRRTEHFHGLDLLLRVRGLDEMPPRAESQITLYRPVQDAGEFGEQSVGQASIFLAVEAALEHDRYETADEGARSFCQGGQLVGHDHKASG